jgi:hypothetical protein
MGSNNNVKMREPNSGKNGVSPARDMSRNFIDRFTASASDTVTTSDVTTFRANVSETSLYGRVVLKMVDLSGICH